MKARKASTLDAVIRSTGKPACVRLCEKARHTSEIANVSQRETLIGMNVGCSMFALAPLFFVCTLSLKCAAWMFNGLMMMPLC